jgi:hypothetical protein
MARLRKELGIELESDRTAEQEEEPDQAAFDDSGYDADEPDEDADMLSGARACAPAPAVGLSICSLICPCSGGLLVACKAAGPGCCMLQRTPPSPKAAPASMFHPLIFTAVCGLTGQEDAARESAPSRSGRPSAAVALRELVDLAAAGKTQAVSVPSQQ